MKRSRAIGLGVAVVLVAGPALPASSAGAKRDYWGQAAYGAGHRTLVSTGDLDGDGTMDFLEVNPSAFDPGYSYVVARSGRTGQVLWRDDDRVQLVWPLGNGHVLIQHQPLTTGGLSYLGAYEGALGAGSFDFRLDEVDGRGKAVWTRTWSNASTTGVIASAETGSGVEDVDRYGSGQDVLFGQGGGAGTWPVDERVGHGQASVIATGSGVQTDWPADALIGKGVMVAMGSLRPHGPACRAVAQRLTEASSATLSIRCGAHGDLALSASMPYAPGSIRIAGDVDGDGYRDLVTDPGDDLTGNPAAPEIRSGRDGRVLGYAGPGAVALQGDVDGDRRDDLVRLTWQWGASTSVRATLLGWHRPPVYDRVVRLAQPQGGSEAATTVLEDVDGDGADDVLVVLFAKGQGAPAVTALLTRTGRGVPVLGTLLPPSDFLHLAPRDVRVSASAAGTRWSVWRVGAARPEAAGLAPGVRDAQPWGWAGTVRRPVLVLRAPGRLTGIDVVGGDVLWSVAV